MKRKCVGGEEQDAFSRRYRKYLHWKPGQLRKAKRRSAKRERREAAAEASRERQDA
jgi:hypothetical protein